MSFVLGPVKKSIFDTLEAWTDDHYKTPKDELNYLCDFVTVHPSDYLPVTIIQPDINDGPWIAGGACLRWIQNRPVGEHCDIDVFCKNEKQAKKLIKDITETGLKKYNGDINIVIKTDNAVTFNVRADNQEWKIQVITCKYFDNIKDVISHFDITVCQIGTTGNNWVLGERTAKDINNRALRFNHITKYAPKRLIKYWTYGYNPVPSTIEAIQSFGITHDFLNDEEYSNVL